MVGVKTPGVRGNIDEKVKSLEARLEALEKIFDIEDDVITIRDPKNPKLNYLKIDFGLDKIKISARSELEVEVEERPLSIKAMGLAISSVTDCNISSASKMRVYSAALAEIGSSGITELKGSMVKLGDGALPVARQTDTVTGGPGAGVIVTGNPAVMA